MNETPEPVYKTQQDSKVRFVVAEKYREREPAKETTVGITSFRNCEFTPIIDDLQAKEKMQAELIIDDHEAMFANIRSKLDDFQTWRIGVDRSFASVSSALRLHGSQICQILKDVAAGAPPTPDGPNERAMLLELLELFYDGDINELTAVEFVNFIADRIRGLLDRDPVIEQIGPEESMLLTFPGNDRKPELAVKIVPNVSATFHVGQERRALAGKRIPDLIRFLEEGIEDDQDQ